MRLTRSITEISIVIMISCLLAACASMPLSTMWKLSRMGPDALIEANPDDIRAAVLSDRWFLDKREFDRGTLRVALRSPKIEDREWIFLLDEAPSAEGWRLDPPPPEQRWRVYRIAPDELQSFQLMQREMPALIEAAKADKGSNTFAIGVRFAALDPQEAGPEPVAAEAPPGPESVPFRIDLQIDAAAGFMTIIREHDFELDIQTDDAEIEPGSVLAPGAAVSQGPKMATVPDLASPKNQHNSLTTGE